MQPFQGISYHLLNQKKSLQAIHNRQSKCIANKQKNTQIVNLLLFVISWKLSNKTYFYINL